MSQTAIDLATWICWGAVIVTWIAAWAYGARSPHGRRQGFGADGLWRFGTAVAAVVVYRLARRDLHRASVHSLWLELPGLVLLVGSTTFTLWARRSLGRMWSASPDTLQADHELRTGGAYAITRHPIYTGLLGMLVGTVLLNGFGGSLVLLAVGAVVIATRVPVEERLMSRTFPDGYARYRERVPRLVPGLGLLRHKSAPHG
jgi:protein-S-isoprenylcysteine O-methyltransferase Ste14